MVLSQSKKEDRGGTAAVGLLPLSPPVNHPYLRLGVRDTILTHCLLGFLSALEDPVFVAADRFL
jgi:hypothetical protein